MGNGEWGMGNGEWGMGNGEWGMGNGECCCISDMLPLWVVFTVLVKLLLACRISMKLMRFKALIEA
ncbi:MAG: hypothetical protein F6K55_38915 [Moorea sp. SIO4A3]|nr:hypothetical protein [Moorena sp. SIO4A3]